MPPLKRFDNEQLKKAMENKSKEFWLALEERSFGAEKFEDLLFLRNLGKKALKRGVNHPDSQEKKKCRLAIIGAGTLYPLSEFIEHLICLKGVEVEVLRGEYDNYLQEILDPESKLFRFQPDTVLLFPSPERCVYQGSLTDPRKNQQKAASETAQEIIRLCAAIKKNIRADVIVANFALPGRFDWGSYRVTNASSDWTFKKLVNLELGFGLDSVARVCDVEFLSCRMGTLEARNDRKWFESKQLYSPDFQVLVAKEVALMVLSSHSAMKKVVVLDLDNTIWGGVVGDDGLEGIEIGSTSPRGEAFQAFQKYLKGLKKRGVLLAVCSKNDYEKAVEPFEKHPEMVIGLDDVVSFKANWKPKSDNIREIAEELNLGLESFVFVDDNPAEIEIVRQFVPEVTTILLGGDPTDSIASLSDSRLFEPKNITKEDEIKTHLYRQEALRRDLLQKMTDMDAFLESLEMKAFIAPFCAINCSRIAQLINKSNQFNLTSKRRTEAEIRLLMEEPRFICFTVRLSDKFGDHGLISLVIGKEDTSEKTLEVDTWLMSCRVLKRQVEDEVMNEIFRIGKKRGLERVKGYYFPTSKNGMVSHLYEEMGFQKNGDHRGGSGFVLNIKDYKMKKTKISVSVEDQDEAK